MLRSERTIDIEKTKMTEARMRTGPDVKNYLSSIDFSPYQKRTQGMNARKVEVQLRRMWEYERSTTSARLEDLKGRCGMENKDHQRLQ